MCISSECTIHGRAVKRMQHKIQQRGPIYAFFKWLPVCQCINGFYSRTYRFLFLRAFSSAKNDGTRKKSVHSKNIWVFVKMAKTGIIVRSTPLFSCPFHILSHGEKKSQQNIIKTLHFLLLLLPFLWFVIVRFLLGHFLFLSKGIWPFHILLCCSISGCYAALLAHFFV